MRHLFLFLALTLITLLSCQPKHYSLYYWGHFNIQHGYDFINKIGALEPVNKISIVDTRANGNEFRVNEQTIFLDTSHADMPNYYSYIKRAKELNIPKDSLYTLLNLFYKIGVNEFIRQRGFYQFPVVESVWTKERGYVYAHSFTASLGDTIATRVGELNYKLVLVKQVDKNWFEYYSTPSTTAR